MLYLTKRRDIRRFDEAALQAIDISVGWVETALSSKPNMASPETMLDFAALNPTYGGSQERSLQRTGMAATSVV
ncbi:hypothetical protein SB18R_02255 [Pseudomonas oryzihabitans]|nr:hypothetical protein SB9_05355 [Pseudomonas psychrotolerans]KTT78353.1 hypothetical protein SB18R_02255 [Pseudomonas psychrotolerans]